MGKLLKVEIVKNQDGQPSSSEWRNSYHIELLGGQEDGDEGGVGIESNLVYEKVEGFLNGETAMHRPDIRILRAVVSTPEHGDAGEPGSVRVIPWGKLGTRAGQPNDEEMPLENVVKMAFSGNSGRVGANQYRGVLWQSDVQLDGGSYKLKANISQIILDSFRFPVDAKGLVPMMRQVKVEGELVTSRIIARIAVTGISTRQRTQRKKSRTPANVKTAIRKAEQSANDYSKAVGFINAALLVLPPTSPHVLSVRALQALWERIPALNPPEEVPAP